MAKKTISIRVTQPTYEEFEEYRHDRGSEEEPLSKADAGRQLIETGLETKRQEATQNSVSSGVVSVLMSVAGEEIRTQIISFGLLTVFLAVSLLANTYIPGVGGLFLVPAAVFVLFGATTLFGMAVGIVDKFNPEPTQTADGAQTANEVEQ
jgi:hypothetical protein